MFAAGAEMMETYPVPPLLPGFSLAIGVTSYDGVACTTASTPTATRCPTSTCSASASARRSTSWSTPPATRGRARPEGGSAHIMITPTKRSLRSRFAGDSENP